MRILIIILNQVGRGTYQRASHFSRTLAARGHAVTLMATSLRGRWHLSERDIEGVRLIETPDWLSGSLRSGWDGWNTLQRVRRVRREKFDVVHAVESRPTVLLPAIVARRRGAKLIRDWSDWFGRGGSVEERLNPIVRGVVRVVDTFFEERFRTYGDATLTINPFLRERALALGVKPETIAVIPNGCDTRMSPIDRSEARRSVSLPDNVQLIGYVGNIYPSDAALMAAAFNRVQQHLPNSRLVLVGYFNRHIEPLIDHPQNVIRTGWVTTEQMFQYLAACDVCWLPLRDTGANRGRWPGKLNDYMAMARPVVATAIGNLPDIIALHNLGVTARDDPDEFAQQTIALLSDPQRSATLGRSARHAAETVFNWAHMTDELEQFYRRVLNS